MPIANRERAGPLELCLHHRNGVSQKFNPGRGFGHDRSAYARKPAHMLSAGGLYVLRTLEPVVPALQ